MDSTLFIDMPPQALAGEEPSEQPSTQERSSSPGATYRLQFNAQFRFENASAILDYLRELGVTDLYASPIFTSGAESTHGYDVCSYREFDPKLGGSAGFTELVGQLRAAGLEMLLDIVPNHMRAKPSNPWWLDVLEKGPASPFAHFFDIDWNSDRPQINRKVLMPVLGSLYGDVLEKGEIKLELSDGLLWVAYYSNRFPACWQTYPEVFKEITAELPRESPERSALEKILARCSEAKSANAAQLLREEALALFDSSHSLQTATLKALERLNGIPGNPRSFDKLDRLLEMQHYRLCWWRTGPEQIDYRRFFDITELVCVNEQSEEVFEATHGLVRALVERGIVRGLRVDHPDGLWDPLQYFERLTTLWPKASEQRYVIAEKILSGKEQLPLAWPIAGTTGYEFLNQLNGIFVDTRNREALGACYRSFSGKVKPFGRLLFDCRQKVLRESFSGQFNSLVDDFLLVAGLSRYGRDFSAKSIRTSLSLVIAAFPVYRTYVTETTQNLSNQETAAVEKACAEARRRVGEIDSQALEFLRQILLLDYPLDFDEEDKLRTKRYVMRFQQLTAPLAAKGMEDTACYIFNRLLSLNEVGGTPDLFGFPLEEFHRANEHRALYWPKSLLATSTHDTKRGEDTRARINVISEMPDLWAAAVTRWKETTPKSLLDGNSAPHPNDEYFLYQTLLGTWPANLALLSDHYRQRILQYMLKAIRESKERTSWTSPNADYEKAVETFIRQILEPTPENRFLPDFAQFAQKISFFGYLNSLSQVVIKSLAPGVPDFYQGSELWDFSLVDPDNRRPVDFSTRIQFLREMMAGCSQPDRLGFLRELLERTSTGEVKLFVTWQLLRFRKAHSKLFETGRYQPLRISGPRARHLCAFARVFEKECAVAIAPRLLFGLTAGEEKLPVGPEVWADTKLSLPRLGATGKRYKELFTGRILELGRASGGNVRVPVGELLRDFPVAVWAPEAEQ
jgi:(1->4)-alpha-D-glucan 1-alpha-D-glucosylmutase